MEKRKKTWRAVFSSQSKRRLLKRNRLHILYSHTFSRFSAAVVFTRSQQSKKPAQLMTIFFAL